ncbi:uncharacterized protein LOC118748808 isoform X2 [Rhagoletis pomonella]|uniref:uncharacterized protein LOC118748808 isoform X2 n=1 Tax=Rhagoletis pomonella TaxID=28610 RepID=UPI0017801466|nr:uncharacterized protein LOC118748808 isoform X2 [Rhagoletis pomonella]
MTDFDTKFMEMQKYLPFLRNVIEKLRSSSDQDDDNPRMAQLKKMEVLHDLLKDNKKKLKMETLMKCEGLLLKLASKMERGETETSKPTSHTSNINNTTTMSETEVPSKTDKVSSVDVVDITGPESPPPQPLEEVPPVEIPTERRKSPMEGEKLSRDRHKQERQQKHHHHHYHHQQRHEHHESSHQSREHHTQQQQSNLNRSVARSSERDRSSDSSKIFNRRSAGMESSKDVVPPTINAINRDKNHVESSRNRDPRASNAFAHEIYSPEECWDDFEVNKRPSFNTSHSAKSLTPDSPPISRLEDRYHDTIFNFKKHLPKSNDMFSRVRNPDPPKTVPGRSAPISIPVKVPTIPEVLKSPPLSASDISDLLSESEGNANDKSIPSIAGIGTRRPAKSPNNTMSSATEISPSEASNLDKIRKKFAIVTKGSPQRRDSPDMLKPPVTTTKPKDMESSLPNERVALKYKPHPRAERSTYQNNSDLHATPPADPRLNPNRFVGATNKSTPPSASNSFNAQLPQDPRLRKPTAAGANTGLYQQPQVSPHNMTSPQAQTNSKVSATVTKPPGRIYQIPSILDIGVKDPRASLSPNYPSGPMDPRQRLTNNILINPTQVGIYSRRDFPVTVSPKAYGSSQPPIEFAPRENKPTSTQRSKSGYSSEENWDSDPETPPVVNVPKIIPPPVPLHIPQNPINRSFNEYVKGKDAPVNSGFRAANPHLLPTPPFERPNVGHPMPPRLATNQHLHQISAAGVPPHNPNHSKFSALLNDKTERSKYFESKKQKQSEPRTYVEYKQAKARAAAEEAARRAAAEAAKTAENSKDIGEVAEVDSSVLAKLSEQPPAASTLDKLYRSTDFSTCEFPKAKTSFKIPKKTVEKPVDNSEAKPKTVEKKEEAKENKSEVEVSEQKQQKKEKEQNIVDTVKKNKTAEKQATVQGGKIAFVKNPALKKDMDEVKEKKEANEKKDVSEKKDRSEKKEVSEKKDEKAEVQKKDVTKQNEVNEKNTDKINLNKEAIKKDKETNKKVSEKVKTKTVNKMQETKVSVAPVNAEVTQVASANSKQELGTKIGKDNIGASQPACGADLGVVAETALSNFTPSKAPASISDEPKEVNITQKPIEAEISVEAVTANQESGKSKPQKPVADNETKEESKPDKGEGESPSTTPSLFSDNLGSATIPARILRRRNTMVVRGSLPEVDKDKIFPFKSLVYEDIQGAKEEERRKEIDAMLPKKNKCLAEMFQRTDDNCKVSTQNIISGKRRTRTNVNFNEVQRTLEVFQHKRRSEPLKPPSEKASPVVKKTPPKGGKKGPKSRVKTETNETGSDQVTEDVEITEQVEAEETEKKKRSVTAKTIKQEKLADEEKPNKCATGRKSNVAANAQPLEEADTAKPSPAAKAVGKSAKPSRIDVLMDEDAQKRHLLESFVQDILNPKKDKAQIFSLLSQILSEDNLKFVKEIVETQAEKNSAQLEEAHEDEAGENESVASACEDLQKPEDVLDKKEGESDAINVAKPPKAKRKYKNELDRLNEDIRTMFISQGVLTATGRRMCTLVAAAEQADKVDDAKDVTEKPSQTAVAAEVNDTPVVMPAIPRIRKAKVVLKQLNVNDFQRRSKRNRKGNNVEANDSADELESEVNSISKTDKTPPRKMPVLKPHTPIKQSEVEDDSSDEPSEEPAAKKVKVDVKAKQSKPGPKSKKPKEALLSDDEEVVAESDHALENANDSASKSAPLKNANDSASKSAPLKNTNKEWHSQSKWTKWCVICDTKINFPATHYKGNHGEYYASRLSPEILEKMKAGKMSKPFFGVNHKKFMYWSYRCPFCLQHNRTVQSSWTEHFITHTGEYLFECSDCHRPSSKANQLDTHTKTVCVGATVVRKNSMPHGPVLTGHVCHLCNYIQLNRQNLDDHYINQHGKAKSKIAKLGYTIDLFDIRDVENVDALKAIELETKILNEGLDREDIEEAKTQEETNEEDEESNAALEEPNSPKSDNESIDSDDLPIAKSVQCKQNSDVKKSAVEKALNSNVFVPTRETNESPTMNNFAQSLFTISHEQPVTGIDGVASAVGGVAGGSISMAERLSQRFKSIKSGKVSMANTNSSPKPAVPRITPTTASTTKSTLNVVTSPLAQTAAPRVEAPTILHVANAPQTQNKSCTTTNTATVDPLCTEKSTVRPELNPSTETAFSTNTGSVCLATEKRVTDVVTSSAIETAVDSPAEDDDDNWEDIEITESAPSTSSSVVSTASSAINSKNSKSSKKNVLHKLNRLYATNTKLKRSLSITIGSKRKPTEERKDGEPSKAASKENATHNVVVNVSNNNVEVAAQPTAAPLPSTPAPVTPATPTPAPPATPTPAPVTPATPTPAPVHISNVELRSGPTILAHVPPLSDEPNLGFRPLITNLADLLPDSPLNDPIELVPELTPMESLQDLRDVSSILNSDYMSDNWEANATPMHLDNDSQQADMQEALDFVNEQQQEQSRIVATTAAANEIGPLMALTSIHRIENIGYSKSIDDNTFKFYCLSENCTFLYSSEAIGLETHFSCEHKQSTWNGYCHSCKAQVEGDAGLGNKFPLSVELNHMRTKHLASPILTPLPAVEELKQPSKSNSPGLDDDRPRIKIRRLTGDCLSTTPTPTSAQGSKPVTVFDENAQQVELTTIERSPSPAISTSFLNQIQPPAVEKPIENRHFQNIGAQDGRSPSKEIPSATVEAQASTPPCQLQIASVVSLKENNAPPPTTPSVQLPVISNVCSLNSRSNASPTNNTGSLWAQHIAEERAELERSASESLEVSRILARNRRSERDSGADRNSVTSDSPEPQVVAETVPVGQATTGSYLITQTVSAQYEEGRLGFNISIAANPSARISRSDSGSSTSTSSVVVPTAPQFKCMANGCKYQTRLPLAMGDHLQFHDRQNFSAQREYLRCSQCSFLAEDVDGFMQHTDQKHGMLMRSASDTGTIRDILRNPDSNGSQQGASENATTSTGASNYQRWGKKETFTQETWETALKDIVSATGVPDSKLFRCTIEDCKTKLTEASYYSHVVYHLSTLGQININAHTYKCPHCKCTFNKPQKIKTHIKSHGIHRYFCYMCTNTAINIEQMQKHFEDKHWRCKKLRPTLLPFKATDKQSSSNSYYVIFTTTLSQYEIQQFREKLIVEWQRKKSSSRTHFKPSEIGLLPLTPIFDKILNCAVCPYKTKVRTNLMRHLQMHTDDSNCGPQQLTNLVDPINPVPCLKSNEKHFDRMTNLASSSLVVGSSSTGNATSTANDGNNAPTIGVKGKVLYAYIPDTKRYTCGVSNCQYLTISDDIFRSHLNALHGDILNYNCPHCKEEICKRNLSIERILNHLRFHGPKLYQCESCGYLHYMKNVVDRHIRQHDVDPPLFVKVIEYDRTKENAAKNPDSTVTSATPMTTTGAAAKSEALKSKGGKQNKWSCNLCGHKTMTHQQIVAHATSQHSCKHQYQCMHCAFTAPQLVQVMTHIDEKHSGKKREARYVFEKLEEQEDSNSSAKAIDTRPLWQRDDPTRVRHIRGILMEDEEESERYQKRLCLDDNDEGTENGDSDENLNLEQFGFLCYYCNTKFPNFEDLRDKHWQSSGCQKFDTMKPFRYRICTTLKCPHCLSFTGNSIELIAHMKEMHQATKYLAADAYATSAGLTCGHCEYRGQSLAHLAQHTTRLRHKPLDLKVMSLAQLEKLKTLGSPLTYVQCLSCMELLANEAGFVEHTSLAHPNECDIKSQIIESKLIYSCPICPFTSQQEMTVLRHMIDHYSGFKRCYFCTQPQSSFNGYMQHCYSDHREEIKNFCYIYTSAEISRYLQQLQLIFPNGLTVDLCNLRLTQYLKEYGNKQIKLLYDEIQKTSQQPPIPRLSLGRLVARKSIEAKMAETGANSPTSTVSASSSTTAALQLAGNNAKALQPTLTAQKIMKRRSTIALGRDESVMMRLAVSSPTGEPTGILFSNKKRKTLHNLEVLPPPTAVVRENVVMDDSENSNFSIVSDSETSQAEQQQLQPFSYYGKPIVPLDLNKIFIKIAAADTVQTRITISKFKLLYNITPRVVVTPTDMTKYRKAAGKKRKTIKPCPLSHKIRYS